MKPIERAEMLAKTKLSHSLQYQLETAGDFPARRFLASKKLVWCEDEIDAWLASRPAVTLATTRPMPAGVVGKRGRKKKITEVNHAS